MARVVIDPGWRDQVMADWEEFAESRLGEDIADDARRYCPVDTGALKASIEHHMEEEDLIVSAAGGGEDDEGNLFILRRPGRLSSRGKVYTNPGRNKGTYDTRTVHHVELEADQVPEGHGGEGPRTYAAYVELGHRVFHPSTRVVGPEVVPAQPFLRPALFQERSE